MSYIEPTLVTSQIELDHIGSFPQSSAGCFTPGSVRAGTEDATIKLYSEPDAAKAMAALNAEAIKHLRWAVSMLPSASTDDIVFNTKLSAAKAFLNLLK